MSRPRTLRSKQVETTLALLDLMAVDPQIGANELMRQLNQNGVKLGRTEALRLRRSVLAVVAAAVGAEVDVAATRRSRSEGFCTTRDATAEVLP